MGGANKDEALRCLQIAKEALEAGDDARAFRFLSKARRLDPSLPVDDLLSSINGRGDKPSSESADSSDKPPKVTSRANKVSPSSTDEPSRAAYTEEQVTVVRHIKEQTDYYQILGVERSCSVEDVRKAYRKLSLKVHPDKNKAPGSEEAFKAVSKAFQCLSDEERRKTYDIVGSEEPPRINRHAARTHHGVYRGFDGGYYEADVDAEEIFRNFFFGGMGATTTFGAYRFRTGGMGGGEGGRHHPGVHVSGGGSNFRILLQVLPVLVLLLLNFLPSHDPPYALSRSHPYEHKLETPRGVPFFVKRDNKFEQDYPFNSAERMKLEESVEREYVGIVSQNCRVELQRQRWGYGNKMPHCDMLRKYEATFAQSE